MKIRIELICFFSLIYPINSMKKGFLTAVDEPKKIKEKNNENPPIIKEQNIGESSKKNLILKKQEFVSNLKHFINANASVDEKKQIDGESSKSFEQIQILSSNEENPLEEIKIRVLNRIENIPRHAFVVVGNYEFDFLEGGARRRKFRNDIHIKLSNSDKKKSKSFKKKLFVAPSKASEVFFEMSKRFWYSHSFSSDEANCLDFVYNFVCTLFDGNCPKKKVWPVNFVELDADMISFYSRELRFPSSVFKRQLRKLPDDTDRNCVLTDHRVRFCLILKDNELDNSSNFVLFHTAGRFRQNVSNFSDISKTIYVQTVPEKVWMEGKQRHIRIDAVLKAYSCKIGGNDQPRTPIVANLLILNETTRKVLLTKSICHSHNICTFGSIKLDDITDHIVQIDVNGWRDVNFD